MIYRGPYSEVDDDDGHAYLRGRRIAVCERTYNLLTGEAYGDDFIGILPAQETVGKPWDCATGTLRAVSETKGSRHQDKCNPSGGCC